MSAKVTVFWRPMCGYCDVLKRDLDMLGVPFDEIDIWQEREHAETVRNATGGDEIVPTVQVGDRFLINPRAQEVVDALAGAR